MFSEFGRVSQENVFQEFLQFNHAVTVDFHVSFVEGFKFINITLLKINHSQRKKKFDSLGICKIVFNKILLIAAPQ